MKSEHANAVIREVGGFYTVDIYVDTDDGLFITKWDVFYDEEEYEKLVDDLKTMLGKRFKSFEIHKDDNNYLPF